MGSIGSGISSLVGGVANGVEGLFGGGSANGEVKNATGQAQNALGSESSVIGQEAPYLNQEAGYFGEAGNALGGVGTAAQGQIGLANGAAGQYNQYEPGALQSFMTSNGLNADGTVNQNFDPLGNGVGSSLIGKYSDTATQQGDQAVGAANKDLLDRGLGQSSLAPSEIGNIRRGQTQDVQDYTRNLGVQDAQMKQSDVGNAVNAIMGVGNTAATGYNSAGSLYGSLATGLGNVGQGFGNVASGYGNVGSQYGQVANGYNGQAQTAQNQANAQNANLLSIAGMFA
jgi:hypothetical protein